MDYDRYIREFKEAQMYFDSKINDREGKAFDYGTLVVRNAILVSGGALLAIPTIAGLVSEIQVNVESAKIAAVLFSAALLLAILGAYLIHVNWTLHVAVWEEYWERRQKFLKDIYLEDKQPDTAALREKTRYDFWVTLTFYLPHVLAFVYLIVLGCGLFHLYQAFGVS